MKSNRIYEIYDFDDYELESEEKESYFQIFKNYLKEIIKRCPRVFF